jgi:hypothetical protein
MALKPKQPLRWIVVIFIALSFSPYFVRAESATSDQEFFDVYEALALAKDQEPIAKSGGLQALKIAIRSRWLGKSKKYYPHPLKDLPLGAKVDPFDQFVIWDSYHNPEVNGYGFTPFDVTEFPVADIEIPLEDPALKVIPRFDHWFTNGHLGPNLLTIDFADYLPPEIRHSMLFERDGKKWVRWPLSPYDTKYGKELIKYLEDLRIPFRRGAYFTGRATASRSMILRDPETGHQFSYKTSSNATINSSSSFELRPYPARWGYLNRRLSDYYYRLRHRLKTLDIAWEAGMLGLPAVHNSNGELVDAAATIRLMEPVNSRQAYQMSGFVMNDIKEVRRLADLNGMTEEAFRRRLGEILGEGLTELNAILGLVLTSSHLQNVRFEFDSGYQLTGRLIVLDLSDVSPIRTIIEKNGEHELLKDWAAMVENTNPILDGLNLRDYQSYRNLSAAFPKGAIVEGIGRKLKELFPESPPWTPLKVIDVGNNKMRPAGNGLRLYVKDILKNMQPAETTLECSQLF